MTTTHEPREHGAARWSLIEIAATSLLQCVEPMPNGHWLVRVGRADEYHAALSALRDLVSPVPRILEWLLTNGGAPMFAYGAPRLPVGEPHPVGADIGRFSIAIEGAEYVLRMNDDVLDRASVTPFNLIRLQGLAEGAANVRAGSAGDRDVR